MINPAISTQSSQEHHLEATHIQQTTNVNSVSWQSEMRQAEKRQTERSKGITESQSALGASILKAKLPADQNSASVPFRAILSDLSAVATVTANTLPIPGQKNVSDVEEFNNQMAQQTTTAETSSAQSNFPSEPENLANSTNRANLRRALAKQTGAKPSPKSSNLLDARPVIEQTAVNAPEFSILSSIALEADTKTTRSTQKKESSDPSKMTTPASDTTSHADLLVAMLQLPPRDIQSPPPKFGGNDITNQPINSGMDGTLASIKHDLAASYQQTSHNNSNVPGLTISSSMEAVNLINPGNKTSNHPPATPDVTSTTATAIPNIPTYNHLPDHQQVIATPLSSNNWADEFSKKINLMSIQQNYVAELYLNPPDLGPLDVVLSVSGNQADALFASPHSAVREAVENAMPKLRELLADNGINLGSATVSDQSLRDRDPERLMRQNPDNLVQDNNPAQDFESDNLLPADTKLISVRRHLGMVDTFA